MFVLVLIGVVFLGGMLSEGDSSMVREHPLRIR
jgi:hypothetical protein